MHYVEIFKNINIDDMIKQVENNGVKCVGMYISPDSLGLQAAS